MRKSVIIVFFFLLFTSPAFTVQAFADFNKTKIAVLDFQLKGQGFETSDMGKIVAEWLITALVKDGRFDVIERSLLEKILGEQKLGTSGLIDANSASKIGKVLGAKVIISGSVMRLQEVMEVNARIIDVQDASIIAAENVKSRSAAKLEELVVRMAEKIIRDFPLEGYIVQRSADNVVIDLGRRAGVKQGMTFSVFKEGSVIKHPKTGEVLDVERMETGIIKISDVKEKTATGRITKETSGTPIAYGQMVKNVSEALPPDKALEEAGREREKTLPSEIGSDKKIEGVYNVLGTNPNGSQYRGIVTISRNNNAFIFVWRIGPSTFNGTGAFRDGSLVIDWGQPSPVIYQIAGDGRLIGTWNNGTASEILTPIR